jgi:hypothetical protein
MHYTTFERATVEPVMVRRIEYDSWENLAAAGVIPSWSRPSHRPQPFPGEDGGAGFVPDPPPEP